MSSATVHTDARAALRTRLKTAPGLPAKRAWEGFAFSPTQGVPFVEDHLIGAGDVPRSLGAIEHRMSYIVTLKYPANKGTAGVEAMAGALLDHFKVGTTLTYGSTSVLCERAERQGGIQQEPEWIVLPVRVTLMAFTTD